MSSFIRVRLLFEDCIPFRPGSVGRKKCWFLLNVDACRLVADVEFAIREQFCLGKSSQIELFVDDFVLPPLERSEVIHENDLIRVKLYSTKRYEDGKAMGSNIDSIPINSGKKKKRKISRDDSSTTNCKAASHQNSLQDLTRQKSKKRKQNKPHEQSELEKPKNKSQCSNKVVESAKLQTFLNAAPKSPKVSEERQNPTHHIQQTISSKVVSGSDSSESSSESESECVTTKLKPQNKNVGKLPPTNIKSVSASSLTVSKQHKIKPQNAASSSSASSSDSEREPEKQLNTSKSNHKMLKNANASILTTGNGGVHVSNGQKPSSNNTKNSNKKVLSNTKDKVNQKVHGVKSNCEGQRIPMVDSDESESDTSDSDDSSDLSSQSKLKSNEKQDTVSVNSKVTTVVSKVQKVHSVKSNCEGQRTAMVDSDESESDTDSDSDDSSDSSFQSAMTTNQKQATVSVNSKVTTALPKVKKSASKSSDKHIRFSSDSDSSEEEEDDASKEQRKEQPSDASASRLEERDGLSGEGVSQEGATQQSEVNGSVAERDTPTPDIVTDQAPLTNIQSKLLKHAGQSRPVPKPKDYNPFPPLVGAPRPGDVIAYKILELSSSYCPEVSMYKEGEVLNYNYSNDMIELRLSEHSIATEPSRDGGRFELDADPEDTADPQTKSATEKCVLVTLPSLIEPKLVSS